MIRVFVRANSAMELAGLEALVRSAPSLELAGSSLGRARLGPELAASEADVLIERPALDEQDEPHLPDIEGAPLARVWIVPEAEFGVALASILDGTVSAVLPTSASARQIQSTVEAAASGLVVLHPDAADHLTVRSSTSGIATNGLTAQLSAREGEILNLLAAGLGNKQVAARLAISEHTVKFHVTSIFNKLNASSRAEAVAIGVRRGLIIL